MSLAEGRKMARLNITPFSRQLLLLILFALAPFLISASGENPGFMLNCLECHEDTWDADRAKQSVHEPFRNKDCLFCHAENSSLLETIGPLLRGPTPLLGSPTPSTSHWFEFTPPTIPSTLQLEASFGNSLKLIREIDLPPLADLGEIPDNYKKKPPEISAIKVDEVTKGVMIAASISWKTDRPTSSIINYGIKGLDRKTPSNLNFQTEHQEIMSGLKNDQEYQFRITVEDTFGNRSTSDIFKFSTAATFSNLDQKSVAGKCCLLAPMSLDNKIFRRRGRYLLNVTSTRPFKVTLGLIDDYPVQPAKTEKSEGESLESRENKHIILAERDRTNFIICKKCHADISHHPVNVYAKKGMKVIAEYPTMAGGKISCVSCHYPHASDSEFLLRKDLQKDLCLGCHSSSYYVERKP